VFSQDVSHRVLRSARLPRRASKLVGDWADMITPVARSRVQIWKTRHTHCSNAGQDQSEC
jgi:hypothetical protein